jgi:hypothetical protein
VVPLNSGNAYLGIKSKTPAQNIGYIPFNQVNYLLMYKDEEMQIHSEWVTILPDSLWLYGDRSSYQGNVLVRKWNGQPLKFFSYKDNMVTESIVNDSKTSIARIQSEIVEVCWNVPVDCDDRRLSEQNNNRVTADFHPCFTIECETTDGEPGGPGNGGSGSSSTGSGGGGGGGSGGSGGDYNPVCNPNIAPGTSVQPDQPRPCGQVYTPITVINDFTVNSAAGKFVMSNADQAAYPRFTEMVKNLYSFVQNDTKVLNALKHWSGFSESQILEKVQFGKGPTIIIKDITGACGYFSRAENPNAIFIDAGWVRGLEQANLTSTKQATSFLLAVTVLHEFVHQARAANNLDKDYEYGEGFEIMSFGLVIKASNAADYSYRFYQK